MQFSVKINVLKINLKISVRNFFLQNPVAMHVYLYTRTRDGWRWGSPWKDKVYSIDNPVPHVRKT